MSSDDGFFSSLKKGMKEGYEDAETKRKADTRPYSEKFAEGFIETGANALNPLRWARAIFGGSDHDSPSNE